MLVIFIETGKAGREQRISICVSAVVMPLCFFM